MKYVTYEQNKCAAFQRSRDKYGDLSNMTFGFPLEINGMDFQGPEGLYQALKFPQEPEVQRSIGSQRSGMEAKKVAYQHANFRSDWDDIRIHAMGYTLAVKLAQHPRRFGESLRSTGNLPIVERSSRDPFWGAQPKGNVMVGYNALGRLLTILRDTLNAKDGDVDMAIPVYTSNVPFALLVVDGSEVPIPTFNGYDQRLSAIEAVYKREEGWQYPAN